jgi:hypothetical protein
MQSAAVTMAYTGPRPSPARRWAPALVVMMVAVSLGNAVMFVLNLIERHNLAQAKAGRPVSHVFFDDTISTINAVSRMTVIASLAVAVVGVVWSHKRRAPRRKQQEGESGVEPSLGTVSRGLYTTFWTMLGLSFLVSLMANSTRHLGMTVDDFIRFRTLVAAGDLFRIGMWGAFAALVLKATRLQEHRELASAGSPG